MRPTHTNFDPAQRRRGVRTTAIVMGTIAVLIYVGFIAMGVFAQ